MPLPNQPIQLTVNDRTTTLPAARPPLLWRLVCWLGRWVWRVISY